MKFKKKSRGKLILTLCMLLVTILFSVGGLTILNGVSAGSDNNVEVEENEITVKDLINSSYNNGLGSQTSRVPVKIETMEECIDVINYFLENKAYVATSTGKMNATAKDVSGIFLNIDYLNVCDLAYSDWFAHEVSGRAYWEEGYKMSNFYNSVVENIFDMFVDRSSIAQLNRFYFINDDVYFKQQARGVNFKNGFELPQETWDKIGVHKNSNKQDLKKIGYMSRYFRWDITKDTVIDAKFTKKLSGYQLDFDLDAKTAARDVYKRMVVYLPSSIIPRYYPSGYHYSINLDKYGNIVSFTRSETITMHASIPGQSAVGKLKFMFKYNFKVKDDNFKIELSDQFQQAIKKAGYEC